MTRGVTCGHGKHHAHGLCLKCYDKERNQTPARKQAFTAKDRVGRAKLRQEVIEHYGNKCACCGETNYAFLTVDHVNNDGAAQRKLLGNNDKVYRWIKRNQFPEGFQILCYNCNCAKQFNPGGCPHARTS